MHPPTTAAEELESISSPSASDALAVPWWRRSDGLATAGFVVGAVGLATALAELTNFPFDAPLSFLSLPIVLGVSSVALGVGALAAAVSRGPIWRWAGAATILLGLVDVGYGYIAWSLFAG